MPSGGRPPSIASEETAEGLGSYEFGPRSIETGCQRLRSVLVNTEGLTQDIGHLPLSTSDNS